MQGTSSRRIASLPMLSLIVIALLCFGSVEARNNCPKVAGMANFNLTEYTRASWYIHMQQLNAYQKLSELNCVVATYDHDNRSHVPFFSGAVATVYNYANVGVNGKPVGAPTGQFLCARARNYKRPSELTVAPCFLPNFLGGPYWVLAAGPAAHAYEWAIVSGGQPTDAYADGCTTSETKFANSGLWLFTRSAHLQVDVIDLMLAQLKKFGFTTSRLISVPQADKGCTYAQAFRKF